MSVNQAGWFLLLLSSAFAALLHPPQLTRRTTVLGGVVALAASAEAAESPYRVAMSVLLNPQEQTHGEIVVEVVPEWAPLAAARFKELVDLGFYTGSRFHRVLQPFLPGDLAIAQFGISTSRELNEKWLCSTCNRLPDETRKVSNTKGTLSFAQGSQRGTRQVQVFINLADNGGIPSFLDSQNFAPFARVVSGMEYLPKLHAESQVSQPKAAYYGTEYLSAVFPKLSVIEEIR